MSQTETIPETTETTPANQEIASINGKHYFKHSMSDEQIKAFDQAIEIDVKMQVKRGEIRDLQYASQFLINVIDKNIDTMEEYIPEVAEDEVTETEVESA